MYTVTNYRTKKALKEAVASGIPVRVYQPGGMFPSPRDGKVTIEGPHGMHRWYARCEIRDDTIVPGTVR